MVTVTPSTMYDYKSYQNAILRHVKFEVLLPARNLSRVFSKRCAYHCCSLPLFRCRTSSRCLSSVSVISTFHWRVFRRRRARYAAWRARGGRTTCTMTTRPSLKRKLRHKVTVDHMYNCPHPAPAFRMCTSLYAPYIRNRAKSRAKNVEMFCNQCFNSEWFVVGFLSDSITLFVHSKRVLAATMM